MAVIGIESSAHTFGVGIVDNGKVVANAKAMYKIGSKGMIPREVAETHLNNAARVIQDAVQEAGISFDIAFLATLKCTSWSTPIGIRQGMFFSACTDLRNAGTAWNEV